MPSLGGPWEPLATERERKERDEAEARERQAEEARAQLQGERAPRLAELAPGPAPTEKDGWLTAADAAHYLGVTRKRIHDLTSARALVPDGRDGRTPLYQCSTLDAYARKGRST